MSLLLLNPRSPMVVSPICLLPCPYYTPSNIPFLISISLFSLTNQFLLPLFQVERALPKTLTASSQCRRRRNPCRGMLRMYPSRRPSLPLHQLRPRPPTTRMGSLRGLFPGSNPTHKILTTAPTFFRGLLRDGSGPKKETGSEMEPGSVTGPGNGSCG